MLRFALVGLVLLSITAPASAEEEIFLASDPALSPDGKALVFRWHGDLWSVASTGGQATRLTTHPASDSDPFYSPDGREIAFVSERATGAQVFVMPAAGGPPEQITFDTNGSALMGWTADGEHLLVRMPTDREWRRSYRFFLVSRKERKAPEMLFDDWGYDARLSPDGQSLLFTREGVAWYRKGYRGSQSGQIWSYDLAQRTFTKILHEETGCNWPRWVPDEKAFLYVDRAGGHGNLFRYDLLTGERTPVTKMEDDGVVAPTISADGKVIVFRHGFDFYRMSPGLDAPPAKIRITVNGDRFRREKHRKTLKQATAVAFSKDGLEIAFIAGGDLFVMDTVLREPVQITNTPADESEPVFLPDGSAILFLTDHDGQGDLMRVERKDPKAFWWRNEEFTILPVSEDPLEEGGLSLSPDGKQIAFTRGRGDLVVRNLEDGVERVMVSTFEGSWYAWSPDGRWLAWSVSDRDFNRDVWLAPVDGSAEPVNVSMHPDSDWNPAFSPDGKMLAFLSRRSREESDIHFVWLREEYAEETKRDRKLAEAVEKMSKARKKGGKKPTKKPEKKEPEKAYDLDRIYERVQRVRLRDVTESGLFWSPDSKQLAFTATIDGKAGIYTIALPDDRKPKLLTTTTGSRPQWVKEGNAIRWLVRGTPTVTSTRGANTAYSFSVRQEVDVPARYAAGFDMAWRIMRDRFYDPRLNHRNWDGIRTKYRDRASRAPDRETFEKVVDMMLGELNGSHLGFSARRQPSTAPKDDWRIATAHLGVRFDLVQTGPGLRVLDVVRGGPADREQGRIEAGETIVSIDGVEVGPKLDLTTVLNGRPDRDIELAVRNREGADRTVRIRPVSLGVARSLLYEKWIDDCMAKVSDASGKKLGYLHIRGMSWGSFEEFERQIYAAGYGRDGLVIDVRNNGGGFTADHLLTALTQPVHAYTISRGGGPGYPQDRKVYATWNKPIVVLINQNSFSNAEIFAHAIRNLGRGRLVGVRTAGGVISTGGARIMDLGFIRLPGRGWFLINDGEDMELNGAAPHFEIWPEPGDTTMGIDRQLDKAVEVLLEDVAAWKKIERPAPRYRSDR